MSFKILKKYVEEYCIPNGIEPTFQGLNEFKNDDNDKKKGFECKY